MPEVIDLDDLTDAPADALDLAMLADAIDSGLNQGEVERVFGFVLCVVDGQTERVRIVTSLEVESAVQLMALAISRMSGGHA